MAGVEVSSFLVHRALISSPQAFRPGMRAVTPMQFLEGM